MNKQKPKNKYKLTPEVYKTIKLISKSLPVCQRKDANGNLMWRTISKFDGTEHFQQGIGKIPRSFTKKIRTGKEPILVNHEINLVEIYQKDGQNGVDSYVKFFQKLKKKEPKELEQPVQ